MSTIITGCFTPLQPRHWQHDSRRAWHHFHTTICPNRKQHVKRPPIFRPLRHWPRCHLHLPRQQHDPFGSQRCILPIGIQGVQPYWRPFLPLRQLQRPAQQWGCPHCLPNHQSRHVIRRWGQAWSPLCQLSRSHPRLTHAHCEGTSAATYAHVNPQHHSPQSCQQHHHPTADESHGHAFTLAEITKIVTKILPLLATWAGQQWLLRNKTPRSRSSAIDAGKQLTPKNFIQPTSEGTRWKNI